MGATARLIVVFGMTALFGCGRVAAADRVIGDFEGGSYAGWEVAGNAFSETPASGAFPGQMAVTGFLGKGLANSYFRGDDATGELTSPAFEVTHNYVALLLGGGNNSGKVGAELRVDGRVVRSATGSDAEELLWHNWDVREIRGRRARVRIVDRDSGGWGHALADQVMLTDEPKSSYDSNRLKSYRESADYYREPYRPQFHFTPEINWMNDPNGLVFFDGEYHLFYQYNPYGIDWGHMSWGHAVSGDLVHWTHLPIALWEDDGKMIFSGSAVVDHVNSGGFGQGDSPPLVAIYTSHQRGKQAQCLAYSNDRGRTWTKYAGNPVLDLNEQDFRDPKVFWHASSKKWIMVVSMAAKKRLQIYGSQDLKSWELLSEFGPAGAPHKPNWECPDLFDLPIENESGKSKWVLHVGMGSGSVAGGSGGEYFVGTFDGRRFTSDDAQNQSQWTDFGRDYYAAVTWSDIPASDGRRIWLGWMNNWETHRLPTNPWRSAMSIPRTLSLRRVGDKYKLIQRPVTELQSLRGQHWQLTDLKVQGDCDSVADAGIRGEQLEIILEFDSGDAKEVGLRVRQGEGEVTVVGYDVPKQQLFVDRRDAGVDDFHPAFPGRHAGPLPLEEGRIKMHVFVDSSSVEVFGGDGSTVITDRLFPAPKSSGVALYSRGGAAQLISLDVWSLKSIWRDR